MDEKRVESKAGRMATREVDSKAGRMAARKVDSKADMKVYWMAELMAVLMAEKKVD